MRLEPSAISSMNMTCVENGKDCDMKQRGESTLFTTPNTFYLLTDHQKIGSQLLTPNLY